MTAFARSERVSEWGTITWELRSVNHRYLEPYIRMPDNFRLLEPEVRERLNRYLSRGKTECSLKFQPAGASLTTISLNRPLTQKLVEVAQELKDILGNDDQLRLGELMRWPGVVSDAEPDLGPLQVQILDALEQALKDLVATRTREGERIGEMIQQRCTQMAEQVQQVRQRRPEVLARQREKLQARLNELAAKVDADRLEQELVIAAQKLDVDEELDRLQAHLQEIEQVLKRKEPVGRRLDFLMQELNREANTLSSKSADTDTTRSAVDLKVLIEQMREQIQNIE
ncbi:MAG: YicC/YloC family endoribonuclease [Gammaproteobacteria bacterium]